MSATCVYDEGPAGHLARVVVDDGEGGSDEATTPVDVFNLPPEGDFSASSPVDEGSPSTLSWDNVTDPSPVDTAAGLSRLPPFKGADAVSSGSRAAHAGGHAGSSRARMLRTVLEVAGLIGVGLVLDRIYPSVSLTISLSLFFLVLWLAWVIAVRVTEPRHKKSAESAV